MNTNTAATARLLATAYADYYATRHGLVANNVYGNERRVEARATFYGMAEVAATVFGTSATDLITNGATAVHDAALRGSRDAAALTAAVLPVYESLLAAAAVAS